MSGNDSIRNSTNLLQELINHAQNSITIAEVRGDDAIIIFVNKAFTEMTGYSRSEALNRDCRFLQGKDRQQQGVFKLKRAILSQKPVRSVIRNYKKNKEMFWNEVTMTPYFDEEGQTMYFIGEQKDVTELVELGYKIAEPSAKAH